MIKQSAVETMPAVVIGSGLGALGALRLLRRSGIPVYSLSANHGFDESRSRWFRPLPGPSSSLVDGVPLGQVLEACSLERAVLIPCSDRLLAAVAALPASLAKRFPSSIPSPTAVAQLTSKSKFASLLDDLDLPRPKTLVNSDLASLERFAAAGTQQQLFLKPVDSATFMQRYGVKAFRVRDFEDARVRVQCVQDDGFQVVVQEYVPGPASSHYLIDGFAGENGEVRALFARRRLRMFPADFGDSTHMVSVALSEVEPALRSLRTVLATIRYRGIFSAEFKVDSRDGVFKLLEVNARVWIYVEFAGRCGVDVCTLSYRDALGLPSLPVADYRTGVRLVSPYLDLAGAQWAWSQRQLSRTVWLRSWIGAQQPHFNWTDPVPALRNWAELSYRAIRSLLHRDSVPR